MRGLGAALGFSVAAHVAVATGAYVTRPEVVRLEQPAPIFADLVYEPHQPVGRPNEALINPALAALRPEIPLHDPVRPSRATMLPKAVDPKVTETPLDAQHSPIAARPEPNQKAEPALTVIETQRAVVSALPALPIDPRQVRPNPRFKPAVPEGSPAAAAREHTREMLAPLPQRVMNTPPESTPGREDSSDIPVKEADRQSVAMLPGPAHESTPKAGASAPQYALPSLGNRPPKYPLAARRRGMEGRVVIQARVDQQGVVAAAAVAVSSGYRLLDRAALGAVKRWTFLPARQGGRAVTASIAIPVTFALETSTVLAHE